MTGPRILFRAGHQLQKGTRAFSPMGGVVGSNVSPQDNVQTQGQSNSVAVTTNTSTLEKPDTTTPSAETTPAPSNNRP